MPYYRNIRTGITYKFSFKHWNSLSNQKHYEAVDKPETRPVAPAPKKKSVKKSVRKKKK
jgi:hypothetical protein